MPIAQHGCSMRVTRLRDSALAFLKRIALLGTKKEKRKKKKEKRKENKRSKQL
jgi:hypothetical protein